MTHRRRLPGLSARLETTARELVSGRPVDDATLAADLERFGRDALSAGDDAEGKLAIACARVLELHAEGALGGPEALPLLAAAADALPRADATALAAARYELETFFPALGPSAAPPTSPDVPLTSLHRRRDP